MRTPQASYGIAPTLRADARGALLIHSTSLRATPMTHAAFAVDTPPVTSERPQTPIVAKILNVLPGIVLSHAASIAAPSENSRLDETLLDQSDVSCAVHQVHPTGRHR
jgi:hypothetical protein